MNFKKEMAEFQDSYREGGALTRAILILSFILSLSSLTSLSSAIVEWKGFILEGIKYYQLYFVGPVASAASNFGLSYSQIEIHAATVLSICVTVGMRILAVGQQVAFRVINKKYNSNLKPNLAIYWGLAIAYSIGIWVWYGIADPVIHLWGLVIVTVFYPIFIVAPKLIMIKFGGEYFEKNEFSYFKSYYAYLIALLLIVCVLAAINTGLKENESNKSIQLTANAPAD